MKGAERWSRDHHENRKFAYRHIDFKNAILLDLWRNVTKLSLKTVSEQWRHQALVAFSARHSSRTLSIEVRFSLILLIYKKTATFKISPITFVNAWPSGIDARRQYILLVCRILFVVTHARKRPEYALQAPLPPKKEKTKLLVPDMCKFLLEYSWKRWRQK